MPIQKITRADGGQSRSSVLTEPFDHLIQHIKQADPRLYEALKRVSRLEENITDIVNNVKPSPFPPVRDPEKIRVIIPGLAIIANDVAVNRYKVKIDDSKKIKLELCAITAKSSPPLTGDYEIDWLRSIDESVTFVSLFPVGDRPILSVGSHTVDHLGFAIAELFNGDELRVDVISANGANDMEAVLKGKIVDK